MVELLCPYCFSLCRPDQLLFRCINPVQCGSVDDLLLTEYQFGKIEMSADGRPTIPLRKEGRVFAADKTATRFNGIPRTMICPACRRESSKLICPACHNTLPFQFGWYPSYPIALIGAKFTGKSNYIGVVIQEFKQRIVRAFHAPLESLDDQTRERYRTDYERYLYDLNEIVPETVSAATVIKNKYPLSYRLKLEQAGLLGRQTKMADLTFFDTAGEDLLSMDIMGIHNRYIGYAKGIIVLLDPLQMPAVRKMLPKTVELPALNRNQDEIIERATQLIRTIKRLDGQQKIKTPLAIAFSKVDTLQDIVDHNLLRRSHHEGYVDLGDLDRNDRLWRGYLDDWGYSHLTTYLDSSYQTWHFFGFSALGAVPSAGKLPHGVNAFRVEDPILWLLYKNQIVEGRYPKGK